MQCSLHECAEAEWNIRETQRFRHHWGQLDTTYQCFYNPDDPEQVILERITYEQVVHAMAWPSAALSIGAMIWIGLCLGCWNAEADYSHTAAMDKNPGIL